MKLGVIGHPITQSKSPIIHNRWLEDAQIDGDYTAIDIKADDLEHEVQRLINEGYNGFNVTIPHKQNIMNFCSAIDEGAKNIGAVNTIVINNGFLSGYNTDAFGFTQNIIENSDFDFKGKTALIIGAGGAARAVIQGLLDKQIGKIYITNRTIEKAQILKKFDEQYIEVLKWDKYQNYLPHTNILINTTSLGMDGYPSLEINLSSLQKHSIVTDIVYSPLITPLLAQAKEKGFETVTGIGMLLYQAQKSFEIWSGSIPVIDDQLIKEVLA